MVGRLETDQHPLLRRKCVACGYDGELLRAGEASRCVRCGIDLHLRPAMSYAEMEGLVGSALSPLADESETTYMPYADRDLVGRWVAFLFLLLMFMIGVLYLTAAAMPPV